MTDGTDVGGWTDSSPAGTYKLVEEHMLCTWLNHGWEFVAVTTMGEPATYNRNGGPAEVLIRKAERRPYAQMEQALEDAEKTIEVLDREIGEAMELLRTLHAGHVKATLEGGFEIDLNVSAAIWEKITAFLGENSGE